MYQPRVLAPAAAAVKMSSESDRPDSREMRSSATDSQCLGAWPNSFRVGPTVCRLDSNAAWRPSNERVRLSDLLVCSRPEATVGRRNFTIRSMDDRLRVLSLETGVDSSSRPRSREGAAGPCRRRAGISGIGSSAELRRLQCSAASSLGWGLES